MLLSPPRWTWLAHAHGQPAEPLARDWLAQQLAIAPADVPLARDERGRPQLRDAFARFDCNWSHSGEGLLVALGEEVRVGIDLERVRARPRALAIAERYFCASELAWLGSQTDAAALDQAFARLWCMKEAVLKAHGHGVSFGLERLRFAEHAGRLVLVECDPALGAPGDWLLSELVLTEGYVGAMAWSRFAPSPAKAGEGWGGVQS